MKSITDNKDLVVDICGYDLTVNDLIQLIVEAIDENNEKEGLE